MDNRGFFEEKYSIECYKKLKEFRRKILDKNISKKWMLEFIVYFSEY